MIYKSDKRAFEEAFLLSHLAVLALEALSKDNEKYANIVKEALEKICEGKDMNKILRRCRRVTQEIIRPIISDKDKLNGHKFILVLHSLAQAIIDSGYPMPEIIVNTFEPFLEVEQNNDTIPDSDWLKLKESAEKQARKIFAKLREEGYYQNPQG